jgi:hypothetical protein
VRVEKERGTRHQAKDIGEANTVVGVNFCRYRTNRCCSIYPEAFLVKLLRKFDLLDTRGAKNPVVSCLMLAKGARTKKTSIRVPTKRL